MKVIVGLGNPGRKYGRTRHNAGFMAVDSLARDMHVEIKQEKLLSLLGKGVIGPERVVLAKPQTYMNESGLAVFALLREYRVSVEDLIVIHDELDLPLGVVRVKAGGGHGGHNGLRSLVSFLGTPDFLRVRIGIGRPAPGMEAADYVLCPFLPEERQTATEAVVKAAEAVRMIVEQGVTKAMNDVNQK